jgi:DNA-binding NtrC family response regulator
MQRSTKVLIHDEISYAPEFLLKLIANRGYKAGFAKNAAEIIDMLSNDHYEVVLTNGKNETLNLDHRAQLQSSSLFIIGITDSYNHTQDLHADIYLSRPFLSSKLWRALETQFQSRKE